MSSQIHKLTSYFDKIAPYRGKIRGIVNPTIDFGSNKSKAERKERKRLLKFYTRQAKRELEN